MQRFYSRQTGCTYLEGVHVNMPSDATKLTEQRFIEVLAAPVEGKVVGHDSKGLPVLVDLPPEQLAALARGWRDAEISRVQWLRDRHIDQQNSGIEQTLSADQFVELLAYVQALRDWPASGAFPSAESRPAPPLWLSEQAP